MSTPPQDPYDPYSSQQNQGQQQQPYTAYPGGAWGSAPQPGYGVPYPPAGGPDGYLRGGPVGFGQAISLALKNIFVYQGRASRSAYWWFVLFAAIVLIVIDVVLLVAVGGGAGGRALVDVVEVVLWLIFGLALAIRRLHDIDRTGWWALIGLIPFVGGIVLLVFSLLPGTPGPNRFG